MGGEPLNDGSLPQSEKKQVRYSDKFEEQCPYYLSIGMTAEQYWDGDVRLVRYYRKAFEIEKKRKNQELWLQGAYFKEALSVSLNNLFSKNKLEYLSEPFPLNQSEHEAKKENEAKIKMERIKQAFLSQANSQFKNKEGAK